MKKITAVKWPIMQNLVKLGEIKVHEVSSRDVLEKWLPLCTSHIIHTQLTIPNTRTLITLRTIYTMCTICAIFVLRNLWKSCTSFSLD